jgi:hypothetical protein
MGSSRAVSTFSLYLVLYSFPSMLHTASPLKPCSSIVSVKPVSSTSCYIPCLRAALCAFVGDRECLVNLCVSLSALNVGGVAG